jgi:hypothetical protein
MARKRRPRGKSPFTPAQVDRAIELVHKHGYVIIGLKRHADGFTIMTSKPGEAGGHGKVAANGDDLDRELEEFQARHGQG